MYLHRVNWNMILKLPRRTLRVLMEFILHFYNAMPLYNSPQSNTPTPIPKIQVNLVWGSTNSCFWLSFFNKHYYFYYYIKRLKVAEASPQTKFNFIGSGTGSNLLQFWNRRTSSVSKRWRAPINKGQQMLLHSKNKGKGQYTPE